MEIESSRSGRISYLIVGLALAGVFGFGLILWTLNSGPSPAMVAVLFPIGLGIYAALWMGRPAWIRVGATEVSYVPPLGSAKVFPRSSVKGIVRVAGSRGSTHLELRDQHNRRLVKIDQGFTKADLEKVGQFLDAKLTWDMDWKNASAAETVAMMTPEEHAEIMKRMTPEERAADMELMTPEQRVEVEKELKRSETKR